MKAYGDERLKRDFKQLISLEILSIAVVNYFTSSPEIFRPSNIQLNQVRTLLQAMHHNFLCSVEIILNKLHPEQQNAQTQKMAANIKAKIKKRARQTTTGQPQITTLKHNNE